MPQLLFFRNVLEQLVDITEISALAAYQASIKM
jgi:hypothetical protein